MSVIYIYLLLLLLLLWAACEKFRLIRLQTCNRIIILNMILIAGLRKAESVGVDMPYYAGIYQRLKNDSFVDIILTNEGFSPLYYLCAAFSSKLSVPFQAFVFIFSAIAVLCVSRYICKYSNAVFYSYLLYWGFGAFTFLFSGLRQAMAMSVSLLSLDAFYEKKYLKSMIFLLAAFLFHFTAVIIVPYMILANCRLSKNIVIAELIFLVPVFMFRISIADFITTRFFENYAGYYQSMIKIGGMAVFGIMMTLWFLFIHFQKIMAAGSFEAKMLQGLIIFCFIQALSSYAYSFTRLNLYYCLAVLPLALPLASGKSEVNKRIRNGQAVYYLANVMIILITVSQFFTQLEGEALIPYTFFWN